MPLTGPSHASIFTGLYPRTNGVMDNGFTIKEKYTTLAEVLEDEGYRTAGIVNIHHIYQNGFQQGFNGEYRLVKEVNASRVTGETIDWLDRNNDRGRFFLWVHYFDPHSPYSAPKEYWSRFTDNFSETSSLFSKLGPRVNGSERNEIINQLEAMYDGEVAYTDAMVGKVLDRVEKLGLLEDTVVIILSDHGEGFGRHPADVTHGVELYDTTLRVPFILYYPGAPEGKRVEKQTQLIDVMPTILEILGVEGKEDFEGKDVTPLIKNGEFDSPPAISERRLYSKNEVSDTRFYSVRYRGKKLIYKKFPNGNANKMFFNIIKDPDELNNTLKYNKNQVGEFKEILDSWLSDPQHRIKTQKISEESKERLRQLGYLS